MSANEPNSYGSAGSVRWVTFSGDVPRLEGRRGMRPMNLHSLRAGLPGFFARFKGHIPRPESHADFLEEGIWRSATGKNPHKIIGDLLLAAVHLDDYRLRFELNRRRIELHPHFA